MKDNKKRLFEMMNRLSEDISRQQANDDIIKLSELDAVDLSNMLGTKIPSVEDSNQITNLDTVNDIERWYNDFTQKYGNDGYIVLDSDNQYIWNIKDNENYSAMNEGLDDSELSFNYDKSGNFIPKGFESKNIALRKVEHPLGSNNVKFLIVTLESDGSVDEILDEKGDFEEAKQILLSHLN